MFNRLQIAAAGLVLATALSGCGGSSGSDDAADTPTTPAASDTSSTPEASETPSSAAASPSASIPSPAIGSLEILPGTKLKDQQEVQVKIAGYGKFNGTASVVLCTPDVLSDPVNAPDYCDMRPESVTPVEVEGGVGTGSLVVRAGKSFKAGLPASKCDPGGKCLALASSAAENPMYVSFSEVSFAS